MNIIIIPVIEIDMWQTNIPFLFRLLTHDVFIGGKTWTTVRSMNGFTAVTKDCIYSSLMTPLISSNLFRPRTAHRSYSHILGILPSTEALSKAKWYSIYSDLDLVLI